MLSPVVTVDPGRLGAFPVAERALALGLRTPLVERDEELHSGHALSGPIEVRGARAGQTLVVAIDEVTPRDWGVTYAHGTTSSAGTIDGDTATDQHGKTVSLAPFLGVIGMPPAEPGIHPTGPPR